MFRNVLGRLVTESVRGHRNVVKAPVTRRLSPAAAAAAAPLRSFSDVKDEAQPPFDATLLDFLVCPLSKKPLRYDADTNELINEELGIAYPIVGGIPNMIPQEARLIQKDSDPPPQS